MILRLQSCVLLSSLFFHTTCFDIIKIKLSEPLDRSRHIDNKFNAKEDVHPDVMRLFKKISLPHSKYNNNKKSNKVLIKRVVSHGTAQTGLQYDRHFNTLFKPLVRIHKTNYIEDKAEGSRLNPIKEPKFTNIYIKKIKDDRKRSLLGPFTSYDNDDAWGNIKILSDIHKTIKSMDSQSKRLRAYNEVINALDDVLLSPRSVQRLGENEQKDMVMNEFGEMVPRKKADKWIPHYPFWNYWTYKKPIHEDVCPGQQVKMGNMCIWVPEH